MNSLLARREEPHAAPGRGRHRDPHQDVPKLTTTVPREYVHRASLAEVFLAGCESINETRFALTGQWPRAHTFFNSPEGTQHDPLQAAETIRQVGLYLAHARFGVPLGHPCIMWDMSWETDPEQLTIGSTPTELLLNAVCSTQPRQHTTPSRGRFELTVDIWRNHRIAATGMAHFTCITPTAYQRLRQQPHPTTTSAETDPTGAAVGAPDRPTPAPAARVGRTRSLDVVLAPTDQPDQWLLAPDPHHAIMFDHAGDHIPGMVLLEAARQAACTRLPPHITFQPTRVTSQFHHYVETTTPCRIQATPLATDDPTTPAFEITATQNGATAFSAEIHGRTQPR